jgi:hypothetical protein
MARDSIAKAFSSFVGFFQKVWVFQGISLQVEPSIGILKSNREKEEDLVVTGILPVIPNREAGSLSSYSTLPSDPICHGYKTFENCYI